MALKSEPTRSNDHRRGLIEAAGMVSALACRTSHEAGKSRFLDLAAAIREKAKPLTRNDRVLEIPEQSGR